MRAYAQQHLFRIFAAAVLLFAVRMVPQIWNLFELTDSGSEGLAAFLWCLFVVGFMLIYAFLLFGIEPEIPSSSSPPADSGLARLFRYGLPLLFVVLLSLMTAFPPPGWSLTMSSDAWWWTYIAGILVLHFLPAVCAAFSSKGDSGFLARLREQLRNHFTKVWRDAATILSRGEAFLAKPGGWLPATLWGWILIACGVLWYMAPMQFDPLPYAFERSIRFSICAFTLFTALWLWAKPHEKAPPRSSSRLFTPVRRVQNDWIVPEYVWRTMGRALLVWFCLSAVGELLWFLACKGWFLASFRNYSVWAILHTAFFVYLLALVFDVWQAHSPIPVRLIFLLGIVGIISGMQPDAVGHAVVGTGVDPVQVEKDWFKRLEERLGHEDRPGPYVFIAASGGGSRAAVFTALVLESLEDRVFHFRNGDYRVGDNIVFISGVSGGALGAAYCLSHGDGEPRPSLHNSMTQNLRDKTVTEIVDFSLQIREYDRESNPAALQQDDEEKGIGTDDNLETVVEKLRSWAERQVAKGSDYEWILSNEAFDEMCTDFMAPLLRGSLHWGMGRGDSVQEFWKSRLGIERSALGTASPLFLTNATDVAKGSQVVAGFPELPPALFTRERTVAAHQSSKIRTPEHGVHATLNGVNPNWTVELSEAVRLSANFPWGFAVGTIPTSDGRTVHVVDGGVADNTGIATLRRVLEAITDISVSHDPRDSELSAMSREILRKLKKRGVLLVEIDSGAKPTKPGLAARVLSTVFEPLQALSNATYSNSENAKQDHLRAIRDLLDQAQCSGNDGETFSSLVQASCRQADVSFICNEQENVMTAWALGPSDKARILARFFVRTPDKERLLSNLIQPPTPAPELFAEIESTVDLAKKENVNAQSLETVVELKDKLQSSLLEKKPATWDRTRAFVQNMADRGIPLSAQQKTELKQVQKSYNVLKGDFDKLGKSVDDLRTELPPNVKENMSAWKASDSVSDLKKDLFLQADKSYSSKRMAAQEGRIESTPDQRRAPVGAASPRKGGAK